DIDGQTQFCALLEQGIQTGVVDVYSRDATSARQTSAFVNELPHTCGAGAKAAFEFGDRGRSKTGLVDICEVKTTPHQEPKRMFSVASDDFVESFPSRFRQQNCSVKPEIVHGAHPSVNLLRRVGISGMSVHVDSGKSRPRNVAVGHLVDDARTKVFQENLVRQYTLCSCLSRVDRRDGDQNQHYECQPEQYDGFRPCGPWHGMYSDL